MKDLVVLNDSVENLLAISKDMMDKNYLHRLTEFELISTVHEPLEDAMQRIRLVRIDKIVYEKEERILEKLINIFNAVGTTKGNICLLIHSDGHEVEFYIGTKTDDFSASSVKDGLLKSMKGNLPGTRTTQVRNSEYQEMTRRIFDVKNSSSLTVSCVTGVPSLKDLRNEHDIRGLERLINAMHGEEFSAIFLAQAISSKQILEMRQGFEEMHTAISGLRKVTYSSGRNESQGLSESKSRGMMEALNVSLAKTQAHTSSDTFGVGASASVGKGFASAGVGVNYSHTRAKMEGTSKTEGFSKSESTSQSSNQTTSSGKTMSVQFEVGNKQVDEVLKKVDKHLDRLNVASDIGLWNFAAYFVTKDEQTARIVAANYQSLVRGEDSSIEGSSISVWPSNHPDARSIMESLERLDHPLFKSPDVHQLNLSSGALINTKELALALTLPRKSTPGLPVIEMAEFGRNVSYLNKKNLGKSLDIGHVYHMGDVYETRLSLDIESLSMHTFITGSTGSGKSNTVYGLLENLKKNDVTYLVIEPAKGEYKHVFGDRDDVNVFGTNQANTPLLRLNPFYFPETIHVFEHIDRLVEIFNACWPMYDAMPAILRESIERIYVESGWSLEHSICFDKTPTFPTVTDLVDALPKVIEQSRYSSEVKGNYTGALVTRVNSLVLGQLSKILVSDEVSSEKLFDENCIIDLSMVGSSESKSLLMGLLFIRLQEHRLQHSNVLGNRLRHVTVLEEAHHLLRRTSVEQSAEGSNVQGKSVEMISNGIAEMRSLGEGFIMVDQSPSLLDPSAIRNTNTKIIMRLPESTDRQLVGSSIGLDEHQTSEISKLETGVAVIYQNDWLEPILGKISKHAIKPGFSYAYDKRTNLFQRRERVTRFLENLLAKRPDRQSLLEDVNREMNVRPGLKERLISKIRKNSDGRLFEDMEEAFVGEVIATFVPLDEIMTYSMAADTLEQFDERFRRSLSFYVNGERTKSLVQQLLLLHYCTLHEEHVSFYEEWFSYLERKDG
ncbi:ATP-binding protein [Exiguobacterium sp. s193]|uniref:ATP-binding protein n=1 Tax=Exiguobacterium sp. s193 TaxID=2751207 RepID=UPI001BEB4F5E|nr:ATP-binding protein [Exiguobacterium sp. s193]